MRCRAVGQAEQHAYLAACQRRFVERVLATLGQTGAGVYYSGRPGATCRQAIRRCGFVDAGLAGSIQ